MPEDRTPRVSAPTESIPDAADRLSSRRGPHRGGESRTSENEKRAPHRKKRQPRVDTDWPDGTNGEADQPSGKDRVHFPFFP